MTFKELDIEVVGGNGKYQTMYFVFEGRRVRTVSNLLKEVKTKYPDLNLLSLNHATYRLSALRRKRQLEGNVTKCLVKGFKFNKFTRSLQTKPAVKDTHEKTVQEFFFRINERIKAALNHETKCCEA